MYYISLYIFQEMKGPTANNDFWKSSDFTQKCKARKQGTKIQKNFSFSDNSSKPCLIKDFFNSYGVLHLHNPIKKEMKIKLKLKVISILS